MSLHRDLIELLDRWPAVGPDTASQRDAWQALAVDPMLMYRAGKPAHFTASALPITSDGKAVCLVLHARVGMWLQPGGHMETDDESVQEAAMREMLEETGLEPSGRAVPVLLSRHRAPCRTATWHLDLQFAAPTGRAQPRISSESVDVSWFDVDELPADLAPGVSELVEAARRRLSRSASPGPSPRLE